MEKLVVIIMGQNCEKFIDMAYESVKQADEIIFCDGGSTDGTTDYLKKQGFVWTPDSKHKRRMIFNRYDQLDKQMNGKQRNFYLSYLKKYFQDWWCLCIDADEVVEDLSKIKEFIQLANKGLYSVKMRHFIQDLGHEDATNQVHFVPNRLFYVKAAEQYPEREHPVLQGDIIGNTDITTIWHLAYIPNLWDIKRRYESHKAKSQMHSKEFLENWYRAHLFGQYPKSQIDIRDIPEVILNKFGLDKDEFYFLNRGIEMKHPLQVKEWYDYFKPKSVLCLGCGRGPYLKFWDWFCEVRGIEKSKWAVQNPLAGGIINGDCTDEEMYCGPYGSIHKYCLITAVDLLEHLTNDQLDKTLNLMSEYGNKFLFSIPFIGDPNLESDKTHIQKRTKQDWIKIIEKHGIKIKETPNWLFKEQILIGEI